MVRHFVVDLFSQFLLVVFMHRKLPGHDGTIEAQMRSTRMCLLGYHVIMCIESEQDSL